MVTWAQTRERYIKQNTPRSLPPPVSYIKKVREMSDDESEREDTSAAGRCIGISWLIFGILLAVGSIVAIILIPHKVYPVGICDSTLFPLNITGTYNGTVRCVGTRDSGPYVLTYMGEFNIKQLSSSEFLLYDATTDVLSNGFIPVVGMSYLTEIGFATRQEPQGTGCCRVQQFCRNNTVTRVLIIGSSITTGVNAEVDPAELFVEKCTHRLERVSTEIPEEPFLFERRRAPMLAAKSKLALKPHLK